MFPTKRWFCGRVLMIAVVLSRSGMAQTAIDPLRMGSVEVTYDNPPTEIVIQRGKQQWHADLSKLVRNSDCAVPELFGVPICQGPPRTPCPECKRLLNLMTWDEHHQRLYFALTTGIGRDKPFTIFSYGLASRHTLRFMNTRADGLLSGTVSRSGRYLAYIKAHHSPPAAGCAPSTDLEVVDLWAHSKAVPKLVLPQTQNVFWIGGLEWTSPTILGYTATPQLDKTCSDVDGEKLVNGRIDVASLAFR